MNYHVFIPFLLPMLVFGYEELPGITNVSPDVNLKSDRLKFAMGTAAESYGQQDYLQIPSGPGEERLRVPKAFYHYTEHELGADGKIGIPDDAELLSTNAMVKNNRKEINGIYLPLPNMDPINLHFISQRTFEKGWNTKAHEDSPTGALARARKICLSGDELMCEKALLHYHRLKSAEKNKENAPLHRQLLNLGDLASSTKIVDHEGAGLGVVVGVPGYEPVYVGTSLDNNNDGDFNVRFAPPR